MAIVGGERARIFRPSHHLSVPHSMYLSLDDVVNTLGALRGPRFKSSRARLEDRKPAGGPGITSPRTLTFISGCVRRHEVHT